MSIYDLLNESLGVNASPKEDALISTVGTSSAQLLRNNPNRVAFIMVNLSGGDIFLRPQSDATTSEGVQITPQGGSVVVRWQDDFLLPAEAWYAIGSVASSNFYLISLLLLP